jgi:mono/diheme cytochrome c family protein
MPAYTAYGAATQRSLIAHLDRLARERTPAVRAAWRPGTGDAARGRAVYERSCAGCHGAKGEGKSGPALANAGFQQSATPAFVAITVVRGRRGTTMPAFGRDGAGYARLAPDEVLDVAAFVMGGLAAGDQP